MYKNATKQAQSNNGSPVLTLKLSGKQRNETRNMKHFTCKSKENPSLDIFQYLTQKMSHYLKIQRVTFTHF